MASKQTLANEAITKAVAETTRTAMQAMAGAMAERTQGAAGPKNRWICHETANIQLGCRLQIH